MKNLFVVLTFLFAAIAAQSAVAENHVAIEEPIIIVPDEEQVIIVDEEPVIVVDEPQFLEVPEPAPNVSITINTGGGVDATENWEDYDRGYNDGFDAGYDSGYFNASGEYPPEPVEIGGAEDDSASQVTVETTTDSDGVNVEVNVADDDVTHTDVTTEDEPIWVMDPNAAGDDAAGISPEFRDALNAHTLAVLDWQLKTSERVLLLIMFMSTAGILFAGYQLWRSFDGLQKRAPLAEGETAAAPHPEQANSTVSFDKGKFEVSSPVVGILVLVISLAALYMFLNFVYQIDVVPVGASAPATEAFE